MRIHKANSLHLHLAASDLAQSDREEYLKMVPGGDPEQAIRLVEPDANLHAISDSRGNVLAIGGHGDGIIWFVHTERAERLSHRDKLTMFHLLRNHLVSYVFKDTDEVLSNIVSIDNHKHIRLLKALGASFEREVGEWKGSHFIKFYL